MTGMRKVELLVPDTLLAQFERMRIELGYTSLSEALRDLMRRFVTSNSEPHRGVEKP